MLSTRELLCWAVAMFAAVSLSSVAKLWWAAPAQIAGVFNAIELIAWGCALLLILRDPERGAAATGFQIGAVAVLAGCALLGPGRSGVIALAPLGLLILFGGGWSEGQRRAGAVFVAIGLQRLLGTAIPVLAGDVLLRLDTAAAGMLMQLVVPGTTWSDNILKPPGDVGVTVYMACSSFSNLSYTILCFVSLYALDTGRWSRRASLALAAICVGIIALNTARLVFTARSLEGFVYWHEGEGSTIFGLVLTVVTVSACSVGARWAADRA
jgi:exosortase/archaeosortase family protein